MIEAEADDLVLFSGVTKHFRLGHTSFTAIRDVSVTIKRGEIAMLLGPSGCGKSTLLNLAAGLITPSEGKVLYAGRPIVGLNSRVAYMTQQDHLLPWRTVSGNVAVPLEIAGLPRKERADRVSELLELVGLSDFAQHYPTQVSGGMRKRCALARLLAADRETLLLDEPFGALDAQLRLILQAEFLRVCRRLKLTVLFVTHDIEEAAALGDKCVVFHQRPGTVSQILDNPLPKDRDLMRLRFDARHHAFTNELWSLLTPAFSTREQSASAEATEAAL